MKVILNGETYETGSETLQELFEETHPDSNAEGKAIAVNDDVIPSEQWDEYHLSPEDRVEVIQAVQGG
jgi:thiamine biosynthesis protein ThiS